MKNIEYLSEQISEYYQNNRMSYDDFYPSEKIIIESIFSKDKSLSVLDIGCACGGLGKALSDTFNILHYIGIDINKEAISWAKKNNILNIPHKYIADDILNIDIKEADVVFSLSCADWNIETDAIIQKSWRSVKMGGVLIMSLRLTKDISINNISKSYQYIDFFNKKDKKEKANYVIYNINDALKIFDKLTPLPSIVNAYGYYGLPSKSAIIPYDKLLFAVFAIRKEESNATRLQLDFPMEVFL